MTSILEGLKRAFAAVTSDIETAEAEKATLETRISLLKRERRRPSSPASWRRRAKRRRQA